MKLIRVLNYNQKDELLPIAYNINTSILGDNMYFNKINIVRQKIHIF